MLSRTFAWLSADHENAAGVTSIGSVSFRHLSNWVEPKPQRSEGIGVSCNCWFGATLGFWESEADFCQGPRTQMTQRCQDVRSLRFDVSHSIAPCDHDQNCNRKCRKILLKLNVLVRGQEYVELRSCQHQQSPVLCPRPADAWNSRGFVSEKQ